MPNTFFRFRQFAVHQENCAMKVCTEASVFGAWVASMIKSRASGAPESILDIGTGTGVLSLMLAQVTNARIDAVEIDEKAAAQAVANFQASAWNESLNAIHSSIQAYSGTGKKYDLIISNPPFFSNDLKSPDLKRNLALHDDYLSSEDLLSCVVHLLNEGGHFAVLLAYHRGDAFEGLLKKENLFVLKKINLRQTPAHRYFRSMYMIGRIDPGIVSEGELVFREKGLYTEEFRELLKEYYLNVTSEN